MPLTLPTWQSKTLCAFSLLWAWTVFQALGRCEFGHHCRHRRFVGLVGLGRGSLSQVAEASAKLEVLTFVQGYLMFGGCFESDVANRDMGFFMPDLTSGDGRPCRCLCPVGH